MTKFSMNAVSRLSVYRLDAYTAALAAAGFVRITSEEVRDGDKALVVVVAHKEV